jgi:mono/diheme cytochrome c family protein
VTAVSRNEVILGLATLVLVVFSLFVSMVLPRWSPDFPARGLRFFAILCVLLVAGMLAAVEVFGVEQEVESARAEEEHADTGGLDTGATQTAPTGTEEGDQPEQPLEGDPAAGKELFAANGCGGCHVLEDAGASGTAGPDLDSLQPGYEESVEQITNGGGGMPAFGDQLSEDEIKSLAAYIVEATSGS